MLEFVVADVTGVTNISTGTFTATDGHLQVSFSSTNVGMVCGSHELQN